MRGREPEPSSVDNVAARPPWLQQCCQHYTTRVASKDSSDSLWVGSPLHFDIRKKNIFTNVCERSELSQYLGMDSELSGNSMLLDLDDI